MITLAEVKALYERVAANDPDLVELNINFLHSDEGEDVSRTISRADDGPEVSVWLYHIMLALKKNTYVKTLRLDSSLLPWDAVAEMLRENESVTRLIIGGCNVWDWRQFKIILTDLSMNRTVTEFTLENKHFSGMDESRLGFALRLFLQRNKTIQSMTLDNVFVSNRSIVEMNLNLSLLARGLQSNVTLQRLVLQAPPRICASDYALGKFEKALQDNKTLVKLDIPYDNADQHACNVIENIHQRLHSNKATKGCFSRVTTTIGTLFAGITTYFTEQAKPYQPRKR